LCDVGIGGHDDLLWEVELLLKRLRQDDDGPVPVLLDPAPRASHVIEPETKPGISDHSCATPSPTRRAVRSRLSRYPMRARASSSPSASRRSTNSASSRLSTCV